MSLTVTLTDGSVHEIDTKPGDVARFERQFGLAADEISAKGYKPTLEHTAFMAYACLKRRGSFHGTFDEFLDQLDNVGGSGGDDAPKAPAPNRAVRRQQKSSSPA